MKEKLLEILDRLIDSLLRHLGLKIKEIKKLHDISKEVSNAYDAVENNEVDKINQIFNK